MTKKQRKTRARIFISGIILAALLIFGKGMGLLSEMPLIVRVLCFAVPYLIIGCDILFKAARNIAHGQVFDENFLMTIATIAAFIVGEYAEAVAVMLFYQIGELFQSYAVGKSRESIAQMMELAPEEANVLRGGAVETVDPDEIEVGETIVVRPGEKIPLDGVVLDGESFLDTVALTGESVPRRAVPGDEVFGGCVNGESTLKIRVTKVYDDSTVAKILELVENASEKKARLENFITRFAKYYTPVVTIGAVALAVIPPLLLGGHFVDWILRACTFLIVSCPCALVISVPLGFFGGIGAASKIGVLVKGSNYLEALAKTKSFAFDKTGTITTGDFGIRNSEEIDDEILYLAAAAESLSTHPIAKAVVDACKRPIDTEDVTDVKETPGRGVKANVKGHKVLVGNAAMLSENGIFIEGADASTSEGNKIADKAERGDCVREVLGQHGTLLFIACDGKYRGMISVGDRIKDGATDAISALRREGVKKTVMLSGDRPELARPVAERAGIDRCIAGLLPQDKVAALESVMAESEGLTAYVGDGINDAPVLMRADVGVAVIAIINSMRAGRNTVPVEMIK